MGGQLSKTKDPGMLDPVPHFSAYSVPFLSFETAPELHSWGSEESYRQLGSFLFFNLTLVVLLVNPFPSLDVAQTPSVWLYHCQ